MFIGFIQELGHVAQKSSVFQWGSHVCSTSPRKKRYTVAQYAAVGLLTAGAYHWGCLTFPVSR